jgi:hypothetical protein
MPYEVIVNNPIFLLSFDLNISKIIMGIKPYKHGRFMYVSIIPVK